MACACRKPGCRKSRPLCYRKRGKPCQCAGYHYPHREKSGSCEKNAPGFWAMLFAPIRRLA